MLRAQFALVLCSTLAVAPAGRSMPALGPFEAVVRGPMTKPDGCPGGASACGQARVEGAGNGTFSFSITSFQPSAPSCGDYTAIVSFTLTDGSALELAESGTVCGPGGSFFPQPAPGGSYGNPVYGEGTWVVVTGSGQFAGMTGGGSSFFHQAGAALRASYSGSVGN